MDATSDAIERTSRTNDNIEDENYLNQIDNIENNKLEEQREKNLFATKKQSLN